MTANNPMSASQSPGSSFVQWVPPDILYSTFIGDISSEEMRRLMSEGVAFTKDRPGTFGMLNIARLHEVSPEARAVARELAHDVRIRASAIIGASFHHRVLAMLINKATSLLNPARARPVRFFNSEAEAFAWFDELRGGPGA